MIMENVVVVTARAVLTIDIVSHTRSNNARCRLLEMEKGRVCRVGGG